MAEEGCTDAMARGATKHGARIELHNRVTDINLKPSGEWEVITEQGNLVAETVVNAAGCCGGYGHFVEKSLGFGYVPPAMSEPGTALSIGLLGERCCATVLKTPVYDPANLRLRA